MKDSIRIEKTGIFGKMDGNLPSHSPGMGEPSDVSRRLPRFALRAIYGSVASTSGHERQRGVPSPRSLLALRLGSNSKFSLGALIAQ